jgi:hypothetical protein
MPAELNRSADPPIPCRSERLGTKGTNQSIKNPRRRLCNFHVRRRDARNSSHSTFFVVFKKGSSGHPAFSLPLFLQITRSFLLYHLPYTPTYIVRFFVCRVPPSPILPSLWSCPLHHSHRSPLTTTCGFLPIVHRTSFVFTHTPVPTPPYTTNGLWYAYTFVCGSLHAQRPIRPRSTIIFPSLLGALFEARPHSR